MLLNVLVVSTPAHAAGSDARPGPGRESGTSSAVADALIASGLELDDGGDTREAGSLDSITVESVRRFEAAARDRAAWRRFGLAEGEYALVILRRPDGEDDPEQLQRVALALAELAGDEAVIFPATAVTRARLAATGRLEPLVAAGVRCIDPLRYLDLLSLKAGAGAVLTDSGRAVDEARVLGVPCFALRTEVGSTAPAGADALLDLPGPPEPERQLSPVLGVDIDNLDMAGTVAACERLIASGGTHQHVCINVAKLMSLRDDPELRHIVEGCSLISADGQPIVWASKLLGRPLPERVAGIDLMHELLELSARRGLRPFFLGAKPEVLDEAMRRLCERFPGLQLAGWRDGYFTDEEEPAVCAQIRAARPDILFVAMGSPKKEYFLGRHADSLGVPFVMGVGGAVDIAAGHARRAPAAWQRLGLEWLYRMLQEPRRLGRRYVSTNAAFSRLVVGEFVRTRVNPTVPPVHAPASDRVTMPRVLHVGPHPRNEGGMPAAVRGMLASSLAEHYDMEQLPSYRPHDVRRTMLGFPLVIARLVRFCLGSGDRIVHIHTAARGSLYRKSVCAAVAGALGRPVLVQVHTGAEVIDEFADRLGPVRRRAIAWALCRADRLISVSQAGAESLERRFGCRNVQVVPNSAPEVEFGPPPSLAAPRLLYLGGFADRAKGGAELVGVLDALRRRVPSAELVLAGPGEPSPAERAALDAAGGRWLGWLNDEAKREAFASSAVVVFPSLSEGLPIALLEAMAFGRAIVATRVGGMPEVLTDGTEARLTDAGDAEGFVDAVADLLADGVERDRLGAGARRKAARLSGDTVAATLHDIYRDLAEPGSTSGSGPDERREQPEVEESPPVLPIAEGTAAEPERQVG